MTRIVEEFRESIACFLERQTAAGRYLPTWFHIWHDQELIDLHRPSWRVAPAVTYKTGSPATLVAVSPTS